MAWTNSFLRSAWTQLKNWRLRKSWALVLVVALVFLTSVAFRIRNVVLSPAPSHPPLTSDIVALHEILRPPRSYPPTLSRSTTTTTSDTGSARITGTTDDHSNTVQHPVPDITGGNIVISGSSSNNASASCRRILLIVIFNHYFPGNIAILEGMYGDGFASIVFYADAADTDRGVHGVDMSRGFYQQRAISHAIRTHPDFDGYVWLGDDVLMNHYRLLALVNQHKLVLAGPDVEKYCVHNVTRPECDRKNSSHWNEPEGRVVAVQIMRDLPAAYGWQLDASLGCSSCLRKGMSDSGYIPRGRCSEFLMLAHIFRDIFFEYAIPSIFMLMSAGIDNIMIAPAYYSWSADAQERFRDVETHVRSSADLVFAHPIKLHSQAQRQMALDWLAVRKRASGWKRSRRRSRRKHSHVTDALCVKF
eukprot:scpid72279/ scgid8308/ 